MIHYKVTLIISDIVVAPRGDKGLALGFPLYFPGAPESHPKQTNNVSKNSERATQNGA